MGETTFPILRLRKLRFRASQLLRASGSPGGLCGELKEPWRLWPPLLWAHVWPRDIQCFPSEKLQLWSQATYSGATLHRLPWHTGSRVGNRSQDSSRCSAWGRQCPKHPPAAPHQPHISHISCCYRVAKNMRGRNLL